MEMYLAPTWISLLEYGILALFVLAYALVFAEEKLHLRKSMPVMVAAGLIWILVAVSFTLQGRSVEIAPQLRHVVLEFAEVLLFLISAMSFVNAMVDRNLFEALRSRLVSAGLSVRGVFWITGLCAFFLSPIADNLATSLVMGTVVVSTLGKNPRSITPALVNIVVAANAGGVFSPFGDITTLMVWQKGVVTFMEFFALFLPALVNWLVPAVLLSLTLPRLLTSASNEVVQVRKGGWSIAALFLITVAMTVSLDRLLHLPPFLGMMMGFGALNIYGFFLGKAEKNRIELCSQALSHETGVSATAAESDEDDPKPFDVFAHLEKLEWDTLLFFYGIMLCVGGLSAIGILGGLSRFLYNDLGATVANVSIGLLSAIVDNIPLTFAVLTMHPDLNHGQWLLITLTAGVGGSLLSIGSAAGIAAMGVSKGRYTFLGHLKWSWAILLGYAASILTHLLVNRSHFLLHD